MWRALLAGALCVLWAGATRAQTLTSVQDVRACLPGDAGRTWAATAGGLRLVEADGSERRWTRTSGLASTDSHALLRVGPELWVATVTGVSRLRVDRRDPRVVGELSIPNARALLPVGDEVYVASWDRGVWIVDAALRTRRLPALPAGALGISSLAWFHDTLYVGTAGTGLFRLDSERGWLPEPSVGARAVVFALSATASSLTVGTLSGAHRQRAGTWRRLGAWDSRAVVGDTLASYGSGLLHVSEHGAAARVGPAALRFVAAFAQRGGDACAGGPEGLWSKRSGAWQSLPTGPEAPNDVAALAYDARRDRLWIGGFDAGLSVRTGGRTLTVHRPGLGRRINALALDAGGALWVATPRGLLQLSADTTPRVLRRLTRGQGLPSDDVHTVAVFADGSVLAGTSKGAAWIDASGARPLAGDKAKRGPLRRGVWSAARGHDGTLWLGTAAGLLRLTPDGSLTRLCRATGHLKDDWVTALSVDGDTLWVGTYAGGVARLTPGADAVAQLTSAQLGGGQINPGGLWSHGDHVFAATMKGLLRLRSARWVHLDTAAESDDVTALALGPRGLWVGSRGGVSTLSL